MLWQKNIFEINTHKPTLCIQIFINEIEKKKFNNGKRWKLLGQEQKATIIFLTVKVYMKQPKYESNCVDFIDDDAAHTRILITFPHELSVDLAN
jgi:hypothetical protein